MKAGYYTGDVHVENSIPVGSCAKGSAKHSACCTAGGTNQVGRVVLQDLSQSRPDRWGPRCVGGETRFRPRLYCLGEQPMTLLKAVLKALSDS